MMKQVIKISLLILFLMPEILCQTTDYNKPQKLIRDNDINSNEHIIFHKDTVYVLYDNVFVEEGATLEIEPGTVIKGLQGSLQQDRHVASLIICRGAYIIAKGTKCEPIVFTEYSDSVDNPIINYNLEFKRHWGGIYLLGKANTNNPENTGSINYFVGEAQGRELYGGTDDADSSGILNYVSIRYAGIWNRTSLFLGAVGRRTIFDYVEITESITVGLMLYNCTAQISHISSTFDQSYSFENLGFRGIIQFLFTIKKSNVPSGGGVFYNNSGSLSLNNPVNNFKIYNCTFLGTGETPTFSSTEPYHLFYFNAQGEIKNNLFIETKSQPIGVSEECRTNMEDGKLRIENNLFWLNEEYMTFESMQMADYVISHLDSSDNIVNDPKLYGISRTNNGGLDPRPRPESPAWTMELADYPEDDFFEPVNYAGAFGTENWLAGWSWLWQMGYFDTTSTNIEQPDEIFPTEYKLEKTIRIRLIRQQE